MKKHFLVSKRVYSSIVGTSCYSAPCGFYWYYPGVEGKKHFVSWKKNITCKNCLRALKL